MLLRSSGKRVKTTAAAMVNTWNKQSKHLTATTITTTNKSCNTKLRSSQSISGKNKNDSKSKRRKSNTTIIDTNADNACVDAFIVGKKSCNKLRQHMAHESQQRQQQQQQQHHLHTCSDDGAANFYSGSHVQQSSLLTSDVLGLVLSFCTETLTDMIAIWNTCHVWRAILYSQYVPTCKYLKIDYVVDMFVFSDNVQLARTHAFKWELMRKFTRLETLYAMSVSRSVPAAHNLVGVNQLIIQNRNTLRVLHLDRNMLDTWLRNMTVPVMPKLQQVPGLVAYLHYIRHQMGQAAYQRGLQLLQACGSIDTLCCSDRDNGKLVLDVCRGKQLKSLTVEAGSAVSAFPFACNYLNLESLTCALPFVVIGREPTIGTDAERGVMDQRNNSDSDGNANEQKEEQKEEEEESEWGNRGNKNGKNRVVCLAENGAVDGNNEIVTGTMAACWNANEQPIQWIRANMASRLTSLDLEFVQSANDDDRNNNNNGGNVNNNNNNDGNDGDYDGDNNNISAWKKSRPTWLAWHAAATSRVWTAPKLEVFHLQCAPCFITNFVAPNLTSLHISGSAEKFTEVNSHSLTSLYALQSLELKYAIIIKTDCSHGAIVTVGGGATATTATATTDGTNGRVSDSHKTATTPAIMPDCLHTLRVTDCTLSPRDCIHILVSRATGLRDLHLSGVTNVDTADVARLLTVVSNLTKLHVSEIAQPTTVPNDDQKYGAVHPTVVIQLPLLQSCTIHDICAPWCIHVEKRMMAVAPSLLQTSGVAFIVHAQRSQEVRKNSENEDGDEEADDRKGRRHHHRKRRRRHEEHHEQRRRKHSKRHDDDDDADDEQYDNNSKEVSHSRTVYTCIGALDAPMLRMHLHTLMEETSRLHIHVRCASAKSLVRILTMVRRSMVKDVTLSGDFGDKRAALIFTSELGRCSNLRVVRFSQEFSILLDWFRFVQCIAMSAPHLHKIYVARRHYEYEMRHFRNPRVHLNNSGDFWTD